MPKRRFADFTEDTTPSHPAPIPALPSGRQRLDARILHLASSRSVPQQSSYQALVGLTARRMVSAISIAIRKGQLTAPPPPELLGATVTCNVAGVESRRPLLTTSS